MTHEETIKRIKELVPSIMELEFGCVVETNIFPSYPCHFRLCYKTWKSDILVCENNDGQEVLLSMNDCTILGKPITLVVVLMAVEKFTGSSDDVLYVNSVGLMYIINSNKTQKDFIKQFENCVEWNLSKDNFNDQSEETKTFISKILK